LRAADAWLERLGLAARLEERLVALSHGNQQRVQLAVALVHDPRLLVLDEPFAGLDPEAVDSLSDVLGEQAAAGTAILFSSHQLELVERICRRVVIVDGGRVLADGTLRELRDRFPAQLRVKVDTTGDWVPAIAGVRVGGTDEEGVLLVIEPSVDPQQILRAAQAHGPVEHFAFETGGLVDLYHQMVAR
jgi:ABC-2 type transport system ATP-binding protein